MAPTTSGREARPDVIPVDGFTAGGMPARLGSPSFYEDCLERLADDGVLVANFLGTTSRSRSTGRGPCRVR